MKAAAWSAWQVRCQPTTLAFSRCPCLTFATHLSSPRFQASGVSAAAVAALAVALEALRRSLGLLKAFSRSVGDPENFNELPEKKVFGDFRLACDFGLTFGSHSYPGCRKAVQHYLDMQLTCSFHPSVSART